MSHRVYAQVGLDNTMDSWHVLQARNVLKELIVIKKGQSQVPEITQITTLSTEFSSMLEKVNLEAVENNFEYLNVLFRRCPFKPPPTHSLQEAIGKTDLF